MVAIQPTNSNIDTRSEQILCYQHSITQSLLIQAVSGLQCPKLVSMNQQDTASLLFMHKNFQACPKCGQFYKKSEGCNHMTCILCQTHFCYRCSKEWNPNGQDLTYGYTLHSNCQSNRREAKSTSIQSAKDLQKRLRLQTLAASDLPSLPPMGTFKAWNWIPFTGLDDLYMARLRRPSIVVVLMPSGLQTVELKLRAALWRTAAVCGDWSVTISGKHHKLSTPEDFSNMFKDSLILRDFGNQLGWEPAAENNCINLSQGTAGVTYLLKHNGLKFVEDVSETDSRLCLSVIDKKIAGWQRSSRNVLLNEGFPSTAFTSSAEFGASDTNAVRIVRTGNGDIYLAKDPEDLPPALASFEILVDPLKALEFSKSGTPLICGVSDTVQGSSDAFYLVQQHVTPKVDEFPQIPQGYNIGRRQTGTSFFAVDNDQGNPILRTDVGYKVLAYKSEFARRMDHHKRTHQEFSPSIDGVEIPEETVLAWIQNSDYKSIHDAFDTKRFEVTAMIAAAAGKKIADFDEEDEEEEDQDDPDQNDLSTKDKNLFDKLVPDINSVYYKAVIKNPDNEIIDTGRRTLLMVAAVLNDENLVRWLIKRGAVQDISEDLKRDIGDGSKWDGQLAYHLAAQHPSDSVLRLFDKKFRGRGILKRRQHEVEVYTHDTVESIRYVAVDLIFTSILQPVIGVIQNAWFLGAEVSSNELRDIYEAIKGFPRALINTLTKAPGHIYQALDSLSRFVGSMLKELIRIPGSIIDASRKILEGLSDVAIDTYHTLISMAHKLAVEIGKAVKATPDFLCSVATGSLRIIEKIPGTLSSALQRSITVVRQVFSKVLGFAATTLRASKKTCVAIGHGVWSGTKVVGNALLKGSKSTAIGIYNGAGSLINNAPAIFDGAKFVVWDVALKKFIGEWVIVGFMWEFLTKFIVFKTVTERMPKAIATVSRGLKGFGIAVFHFGGTLKTWSSQFASALANGCGQALEHLKNLPQVISAGLGGIGKALGDIIRGTPTFLNNIFPMLGSFVNLILKPFTWALRTLFKGLKWVIQTVIWRGVIAPIGGWIGRFGSEFGSAIQLWFS